MYGIGGERELDRADARPPVRLRGRAARCAIGNGAYDQHQHDVWGAVLDSVYLHTQSRDQLPERVWPILKRAGRGGARALARARPRHLGGARRAAALHLVQAHVLGRGSTAARAWRGCARSSELRRRAGRRSADEIHADICANARRRARRVLPALRHRRARRLGAADAAACASCRPTTRGSAPPCSRSPTSSPRTGWCCATASRRPTTASRGEEGTFTICSFWLVSALVEIGELRAGAAAVREAAVATRSPLGLYAEEIDPRTGRHLGNFPQAFTHLALINASCT